MITPPRDANFALFQHTPGRLVDENTTGTWKLFNFLFFNYYVSCGNVLMNLQHIKSTFSLVLSFIIYDP